MSTGERPTPGPGAPAVAFTHAGAGTPARAWREDPRWDAAKPLTLHGVERLVVVAAHPDDESLGAGGLVATAVRAGVPVSLVVATAGEGSHPDSPTHTPEDLARRRRVEMDAAAAALGVDPAHGVRLLELPDGGVADHVETLTRAVVEATGDGRRSVVVAPWRQDGHPDHEAAGVAAAAAARRTGADLWEYPVWFWHWATPAAAPWDDLGRFVLGAPVVEDKAAAIEAHVSQVRPLSASAGDGEVLPDGLLEHFRGRRETFVRTPSRECPDDALDRLHRDDDDPWGAETRWYERRKRDLLLSLLPRPRFERVLELGCSTGALAEALARRSGWVVAVDRSQAALALARARFADAPHVEVADHDVPWEWPDRPDFDLVVVSEMGYFLSPVALDALVERVRASLGHDGVLVLCHWRHPVEGWVLDAEAVHARFVEASGLPVAATYADRDVEVLVLCHPGQWPDPARDATGPEDSA